MKGGREMIIEGIIMFIEYLFVSIFYALLIVKAWKDPKIKHFLLLPVPIIIILFIAVSSAKFLITAAVSIVLLGGYLYKNWHPPIITAKRF